MRRNLLLMMALVFAQLLGWSQPPSKGKAESGKTMQGQREYSVIVNQTNDTLKLNSKLRGVSQNRGLLTDLVSGYMNMGTTTLLSASSGLLNMGVSLIKEATRDKRPDWENAVREESVFVKYLPMQMQVLDFYGEPSPNGALDPMNMKFNGFGCKQVINIKDENGKDEEKEVFYMTCSLRADTVGVARMLNHSKFEVVIDELCFNPYLCNLPNDSVNPNPATRVPFSFDRRKNLMFNVDAVITSSWINEAIQVFNDVELGRFHIQAAIRPDQLDEDGVFRYDRNKEEDKAKQVSVTGESFIVPRSYIGTSDMQTAEDSWGTGQYKVNMIISESCQINDDFYKSEDKGKKKWDKNVWGEEWKIMKKRMPRANMWTQIKNTVFPQFSGETWISTLTEPFVTTLVKHEGLLMNAGVSKLLPGVASGTQATTGMATQGGAKGGQATQGAGQGTQGGQGSQGGQGVPQGGQGSQGGKGGKQ
ncbi:MAG: hypothetical protein HDS95_05835 [Bacteroidales bacterium]|nr:hypothetical protein [Bacteroidales bacterium]